MVVEKEKSRLVAIVVIIMLLIAFIHGYILYKGGFSELAIKLHLYALPISIVFMFLSAGIIRSIRRKLILSSEGVLIEDYSSVVFPWELIKSAEIKRQFLCRGGECIWLVIRTCNDNKYQNKSLIELNKLLGINGIPVCNLANYKGNPKEILQVINENIRSA